MASVVQLGKHAGRRDSPLTPELRALLDAVVVPILVSEYLAEMERENENDLALRAPKMAQSCANEIATAEEVA